MKNRTRQIFLLLAVLSLLDLIFVGLHVLFELADYGVLNGQWLLNSDLSLEIEHSYGNAYQHVKQLFIVLLLFVTLMRRRQLVYLAWTAMFTFLMADDLFEFHERGGTWLNTVVDLPIIAGLMPSQYAQLFYFLFVGLVFLIILFLSFRGISERDQKISIVLLLATLLLVFFATIVDQLDQTPLSYSITGMTSLLKTVEEAGELIVFSLILVYTLYIAIYQFAPPAVVSALPKFVWRWSLSEKEV